MHSEQNNSNYIALIWKYKALGKVHLQLWLIQSLPFKNILIQF